MQRTNYTKVATHEANSNEIDKVILLYSGGLDTTVCIKWLQEEYKAEVIAVTINIGQLVDDMEEIRKKALKLGASRAYVVDARDEFARDYIARGIKANASYQGDYYLSTPLGRPLLARIAVEIARRERAGAIAHGCTGKGNDQVRIEGTALTLNPDIKIIAPVREWGMGRDEEMAYAARHGIPVPQTIDSPYSCDDNMWGVTNESGEIESPQLIPPLEKILRLCRLPEQAPDCPEMVELEFVKGIPVTLNGQDMKLADLILALNRIGARHGVGIVHHLEDRVVGLKVRGVYEQPAAQIIITAHRDLEKFVCTRLENKFKTLADQEWAYLCYGGLWLEPLMGHLNAYHDSVNRKVNGAVQLRLYKGRAEVVSLKAPDALFNDRMVTFMKDDLFNQNASAGFIEIHTLQMKMAKMSRKNVLITIGYPEQKAQFLPYAKKLAEIGCRLYATEKTSRFLDGFDVPNTLVHKLGEVKKPNIAEILDQDRFDLIINIPTGDNEKELRDATYIRDQAVERGIQLVTSLDVAMNLVSKLERQYQPVQKAAGSWPDLPQPVGEASI